ncbi:hypothetical protein PACTADRAFT_2939 [Pachysolen tannophilus NRRL Y-2460]|uniref:SSD domain-containing protein n=1 Tax=Pachysolen tannophilus NRRL Y-2460 TaxID=669874 RepID=A0A1E4TU37_PACTA|nr:hypothetical protein PACTADRAFT_2939 [Pachysolen tannophilus NRRL Y-2460]
MLLRVILGLLVTRFVVVLALFEVADITPIHQEGYCALYGSCGKKSLFGSELPCASNVEAVEPSMKELDLLKEICGWDNVDKVCCNENQLVDLKSNLQKVNPLISSCPACKENFYQFFCHFTCSSNQSLFVNVTETMISPITQKEIVTELDEFVNDDYVSGFFNSCKNIKFSASNGYAMDLIGGGAKTYKEFLKFLGDEKPLLGGSPFQINYKYENDGIEDNTISPINFTSYACNDTDYKCACSDCQNSCPVLPAASVHKHCTVGIMPCFSFSIIMIYIALISGGLAFYLKRNSKKYLFANPLLVTDELGTADDDDDDDDVNFLNDGSAVLSSYALNDYLESCFCKLGLYCALYPATIIATSLIIVTALSSLMFLIKLEKNPINLWVSSDAESFKQKQMFDKNFGPFYRSEQVFIVDDSPNNDNNAGSILDNYSTLKWWFEKENEIKNLAYTNNRTGTITTLDDICFRPMEDSSCVIESFTQYFQGDINLFPESQYKQKLKNCIDSPVNCLPDFQQPLKKELLFGGYEDDDALTSKAIVITFVINNSNEEDSDYMENVSNWEKILEDYLLNLQNITLNDNSKNIRLSFNTEISLEKELNKSTNTDIKIIVISYLVMFAYASLALGGTITFFNVQTLITTKFSLGLIGIFVVLLSVTSSAGLCALFGVKSTLIIAEVIPFLILAIGVDNIYLITHELQRFNKNASDNYESIPERIAKTLGKIGPSIMISSLSQFACFMLATFVSMPAVKNFAKYSAGAVVINTALQLTAFVSLLSLDQKRTENNRLDCFPCVKADGRIALPSENRNGTDTILSRSIIPELLENNKNTSGNFLTKFIKNYYAPFILQKKAKKFILGIFFIWFGTSLTLLPGIKFGLDQRIALPNDSYLIDYFNDVYRYLNVGPPVYFVVDDLNVTSRENQQKICGKFPSCNEFSLLNVLEEETKRPNSSFIIEPPSSWLDDFLLWLNPELDQCCKFKKNTNETEFCSPSSPTRLCEVCYANHQYDFVTMDGFPEGSDFIKFFQQWINSNSDGECPLGGKAPYSHAIKFNSNDSNAMSSYFRTSHKPLRSQDDFIEAYRSSLKLIDELVKLTGIEKLFSYSPFYIFFVQYETIVKLTFTLIAVALFIILLISSTLLGSIRISGLLVSTVIFILTDIAGIMSLWNISLNAVSLVNLIICIGLAVEFCTHIARGYTFQDRTLISPESQAESKINDTQSIRAFNTLINIGGSVFSGITMTKFIGILVLYFTRSKIFEIYYFRMWFSLVIVSSLHSLIFLPVLLSYFGGEGYCFSENTSFVGTDLLDRLAAYENENSYDSD